MSLSDDMRKRLSDPDVRRRMSESHTRVLKEQWTDPGYRARRSQQLSEMAKKRIGPLHGAFKHGLSRTPEYRAFHSAKQRCINKDNPMYCNYGMRGIKFLFESFETFIEHIGRRPSPRYSLERIDNDGHYEIGNVKWATNGEQVSNRRKANSHCRMCGEVLSCPCETPEYGLSGC